MNFLKTGLSLVLLGAGLAAFPGLQATAAGTASQAAGDSLVQQMRGEAQGAVKMTAERATGKVGFVRAARNGDLMPSLEGDSSSAAVDKASAYLSKYAPVLGATSDQLKQTGVSATRYGWTVTYQQQYKSVPVFGSRLKANLDRAGDLTSVNGYAAPGLNLSVTPRISKAAAATRAINTVRATPPGDGKVDLSGLKAATNDLTIYRMGAIKGDPGKAVLAYVVEVTNQRNIRDMVFVDANTGKVANRYSMVDSALDRKLYETSPDTVPVWEEGDPLPGTLDADQLSEVETTGDSYWLYKNTFGYDSYDNEGSTMKTVNNDPNIACPNANWNGATTNYCDGVSSDDTVAHEWGHAYTEYTSGLIYQWQPGAMNEAYSDIWGETVDMINTRQNDLPDTARTEGQCTKYTRGAVGVTINSPASIAGPCDAAPASFGPVPDTTGVTADVIVGLDDPADGSPTNGCASFDNAAAISGNFVYVDRGVCAFQAKVSNAEAAGATGIIVGDHTAGEAPFSMSGTADIYGVMITVEDGAKIKAATETVNITLKDIDTSTKDDSYRWLSGENDPAFGGAIRDMWSPTCYGDPAKVSDAEYHCTTDDAGGVHSNSGVVNHTFALLVDGSTSNGVVVAPIGLDKAANLFWRTQTAYLGPTSDFTDLADGLAASCADLSAPGAVMNKVTVEPNAAPVAADPMTVADCAAVDAVALATELRTQPTQCNFQPMLAKNAPSACGAGYKTSTVFSEDFEKGLGKWTKSSNIVYPGGHGYDWRATKDVPGTNSTKVAYDPSPDDGDCSGGPGDISSSNAITSPKVNLPGGNFRRLSFGHYMATEPGYDGGNVKISINGGAFKVVPATAYLFNAPTLIASAEEGNSSPMAGEEGFTGTDGGVVNGSWGKSIIDLRKAGAKKGDGVKIRFDLGRDGCGGNDGWYVDNIKVQVCTKKSNHKATLPKATTGRSTVRR